MLVGNPKEKTTGLSGPDRIIVQELPSRNSKKTANQLQILTRMSIPIFEAPPKSHNASEITESRASDGKFSFGVANKGNVHTMVKSLKVSALGTNDQLLFTHELSGWYVLAGGQRVYDIELPKNLCSQIKSIAIRGQTTTSELSHNYRMPPGSCVER